jgi:hypothetical protein
MESPHRRPPWSQTLRDARTSRGWDPLRLAHELLRAAGDEATTTPDSLVRRIRDWEAGRHCVRERYRLLLARVLELPAEALSPNAPPPRRPDAERVRASTAHLIGLDEATGGTDLVPVAVRHARAAHTAAQDTGSAQMAAAAAEALQVAGWLAFDADEQVLARRLTSAAVLAARGGADRDGELFALSQLAMQDAHEHRPDHARQVCEHVLDQPLPPRVRALYELRLARAHGQANTPQRAAQTLDRARSRLQDGARGGDPPWVWWVTDAELDWHQAMIHADNGHWGRAAELFERAWHGRGAAYQRGALNDAAHLVHALVRVRSWPRAHQVLADAVLPVLGQIRSGRTATLLVRTQQLMEQTGAPAQTRELAAHAVAGLGPGREHLG